MDDDGSEDVSDFLKRIKELGDQRDREDEERNRKLEEEIMQGRKERQARREERARSLSPTKGATSPRIDTPGSARSGNDSSIMESLSRTPLLPQPLVQDAPVVDNPQKAYGVHSGTESLENSEVPRCLPQPPSKPPTPSQASLTDVPLSRAGTLSWAQRPASRDSTTLRSRPQSMFVSEDSDRASPKAIEVRTIVDDGVSRSRIAKSLGSKDPSWFKQTQDRGIGSAAYRRNQEKPKTSTDSRSAGIGLPGMSREGTVDRDNTPSAKSVRSASPATTHSASGSAFSSTKTSSTLPSSAGSIRSAMPSRPSQKLHPPSSDASPQLSEDQFTDARAYAMSPAQGRLSPERMDRPASPTKGLGGFVQSAMMKRSDSVSKRWSTQQTPGLNRGNSIASNRSGYDAPKFALGGMASLGEPKPAGFSRENTPASISSRPSSSHSNSTITPNLPGIEGPDTAVSLSTLTLDTPRNNVSKDKDDHPPSRDGSRPPSQDAEDGSVISPPVSPSKRWSPQKSSWLANAINKPDSPKVLLPATSSQQPSWMTGIARAKQQRGSVDLSAGSSHKQITPGGLLRSPPPGTGYKPPNIGGLPAGFSAGVSTRSRSGSSGDTAASKLASMSSKDIGLPSSKSVGSISAPKPMDHADSPVLEDISTTDELESESESRSALTVIKPVSHPTSQPFGSRTTKIKPKPETPPKIEFKPNLTTRPKSGQARSKDEPEFKNVFGNLKRTQTQNYKAPDPLKDNILRGKAGLAVTGGPKKTQRIDELKESILKKKQTMVAPSASIRITSASAEDPKESTPEAIKKRQDLARSDSVDNTGAKDLPKRDAVNKAEALSKFQQLRGKPMASMPAAPEDISSSNTQNKANATLGDNFNLSLAGILQRGPSPMSASLKPNIPTSDLDPPRPWISASEHSEPQSGPQLNHATKGRAKGPKRKPPTVTQQSPFGQQNPSGVSGEALGASSVTLESSEPSKGKPISTPNIKPERALSNITNSNSNHCKTSQPLSPRKPSTSSGHPPFTTSSSIELRKNQLPAKITPPLPAKSAVPVIDKTENLSVPGPTSSVEPSLGKRQPIRSMKASPTVIPPSNIITADEQQHAENLASVKGSAACWAQARSSEPPTPKAPIRLPTRKDEEAIYREAGLGSRSSAALDIDTSAKSPFPNITNPNTVSSSISSPHSPLVPKKPSMITNTVESKASISSLPQTQSSTPASHADPAQLFAELFDEATAPRVGIKLDTLKVLEDRSSENSFPKIKTLRKQIFEIVDGRTLPAPNQEEHVIYDGSMYMCLHVFGLGGQRMTEVYLYGAPPSNIAVLLAKKMAKDNNGILIPLEQGKETSSFLQALGGIAITRKKQASMAKFMLCGRQYLGQIIFDEVDFDPRRLCSGFPFIVLANSKIWLWKGKGASGEELGCARLIGMDFTGQLEEVDEGQEPKEFWTAFPTDQYAPSRIDRPTHHWRLKSSCERYANTLFSIDMEVPRPKSASSFMAWGRRGSAPVSDFGVTTTPQIKEIVPFSDTDLADDNIYFLDAFFELFVIHPLQTLTPPPHRRSPKSAAFRAALLFAQEYSILAASAEDRPFVPHCHAVFLTKDEGGDDEIPEHLRWAFRKWDRGSRCTMFGLTEALEGAGVSRGS